ncbi:MAG TPA: glycosyltransferase [Flavipsychrobacter sp.]|nr:glycosyltransferase [Flavipsychrobacter sp.]
MELLIDKTNQSSINKPVDTMLRGRDIVIIGLQPWYYDIGSNCKNIALQLAQHNRVLYINQPINRKTYISRDKNKGIQQHCSVIKYGGGKIRFIKKNLWENYPTCIVESINGLPSTNVFSAFNYLNNKRFAKEIKKAVEYLSFKDVILFNDNDIYNGYYLKKLLSPSLYVYYCRDFLQGYSYWKRHTTVLEPKLIKKADVVVANSIHYTEYCQLHNPNSYYIGQGYNDELFDADKDHQLPEDIKHISNPIIGYVGAITSSRLDENIIRQIASSHPDWSIVLVGPEDDDFKKSALHKVPNIHFIGRQPIQKLPEYVNAFDVCINPQLVNKVTEGNYPLKIDEYLSMGKPVVATRTKEMKLFESHTYLANKPEEYPALIEKALAEDNSEKRNERICFATKHTWTKSVNELYKAMSKHLIPKNS